MNENVLSGTAASALFNAEDATPPNNGDGILTRPFIVDIALDCGDDFIGESEDVTTDTLEEGGFTITNRRFEDSTIFAPGTIIRIEQNPDGSLTLIIAREPGLGSDPAKPIPSISTFGLLLLSPLLGLVTMFRKKQK